jgi:hypothetical protein
LPALEEAGALAAGFAAAAAGPQILALVSPTCEVCLEGVAMVLDALGDQIGSRYRAHIVWTPVLEGDVAERAESAAMASGHERVEHYWDAEKVVSNAVHRVLDLGSFERSVAWDVYLLYAAGSSWSEWPPPPSRWLHQLRIPDRPNLDAASLRAAMREVVS